MSAIAILTGLLVVAYFGSILVGGRALRGFGLPSGTEFLILGIVVGPMVFGFISEATLASFEPLTVTALAWVSLGIGLHYGSSDGRKIGLRRLMLGGGFALLTVGVTSLASGAAAFAFTDLRGRDLVVLALGIGCVTSETTRYAVSWVVERYKASGPLSELLGDLAEADDLVPLIVLGLVFALGNPPERLHITWSLWWSFAGTLVVGGVLGATASALLDIEERPNERWGILLGTALLGMGAAMRLGQSALSAMLMMGLTLSLLSKRAPELRSMVQKTERPVVLPALVLAGAQATYPTKAGFIAVGVVALLARLIAKLLVGSALRRTVAAKHPALASQMTSSLGLGLLPSGVLSVTIGLSCALRFPGPTGQLILAIATVSGLLGELIGPAKLRAELRGVGELGEAPSMPATVSKLASIPPPPQSHRVPRTKPKSLPPPPRRPQRSRTGKPT